MSGENEKDDCTVTAVIPAYNEAGRIGQTVRSVAKYVNTVLVIDDASTDSTGERAETAGASVLTQEKNQGYIAAIKRGFKAVDTDIVVTIDADGELPPDRIPALVRPVCSGDADMVQGRRGQIARPSERFLTWLASWGGPVGDSGTGLRALRTELARELDLRGACICGVFSLEVLAHGVRIAEVSVNLRSIQKPRGIAWYHLGQIGYVAAELVRKWWSRKDSAR